MPYDSKAVANYFLNLANRDGETLSPMRLIKLVYIAHGWSFGLLDKPLINERPEAWKCGPVVPSLYHEFKDFGNNAITRPAMTYDFKTRTLVPAAVSDDLEFTALMDRVWDVYKPFTAIKLSAMTHHPGTPWDKTWHELGGSQFQGTDIPVDLIRNYYKGAARNRVTR